MKDNLQEFNIEPTANEQLLVGWLNDVFPSTTVGYYVNLRNVLPNGGAKNDIVARNDNGFIAKINAFIARGDANGWASFVIPAGVNDYRPKQGAGNDDVKVYNALLLDMDTGNIDESIEKIVDVVGCLPTWIVKSGSIEATTQQAKRHLYWKFEAPITGDDLKLLVTARERLVTLGADGRVTRLGQPIRLPNSTNFKDPANPRLCSFVGYNDTTISRNSLSKIISSIQPAKPAVITKTVTHPTAIYTGTNKNPRYPYGDLSNLSLYDLATSYGISLSKHGHQWTGCCPFHNEKNPSLYIKDDVPGQGVWNCQGCGAGGGILEWVKRTGQRGPDVPIEEPQQASLKTMDDLQCWDDEQPPKAEVMDTAAGKELKFQRDKFGIVNNEHNAMLMLDDSGVTFRENTQKGVIEFCLDGRWRPFNEKAGILPIYFQGKYDAPRIRQGAIHSAIIAIVEDLRADGTLAQYHPLTGWLNDIAARYGRDDELLETCLDIIFGIGDDPYNRVVSRLLLIAAASRALNPGCWFDHLIVFSGNEDMCKSKGLEVLFGRENYTTSTSEVGSIASFREMAGKWCIEWPELTALRQADDERIKKFLSESVDRYDDKYKAPKDNPRTWLTIGTKNPGGFIKSSYGNRRFLIVEIKRKADLDWIRENRDRIFAAGVHAVRSGELPVFPEVLKVEAREHVRCNMDDDVWTDEILNWLALHDDGTKPVSVGRILIECLKVELGRQTNLMKNSVKKILTSNGWTEYRNLGRRFWKRLDTQNSDIDLLRASTYQPPAAMMPNSASEVPNFNDDIPF